MEQYKGFYGTRTEYIELLKERVTFWAKAFAEETGDHKIAMMMALDNAETALAAEGIEWDEIEALEIEGMKAA